jgi:hypothetical protein
MEKDTIIAIILLAIAVVLYIFFIARKKIRAGLFLRVLVWAVILYCVASALLGFGVIK